MRKIAVVTAARSDYGIYRSLLRKISADPELELQVLVTGMHLCPEFGDTVKMIEADGFPITERVETLLASDSPAGVCKAMGLGLLGFAEAYSRSRPDLLVILGDRFDMFPGALAALPFRIPIVHIHGGEVTVGAIDDALRHAITKLSHLHFATTEAHGRRVVQMGEEPWRVTVCGAPALDGLEDQPRLTPAEIERRFSIALTPTPLLVTFHPVTLEYEDTARQVAELLGALEDSKLPVVFTAPNADTAGRVVRAEVEKFVASRQNAWLVENFGQQAYFSMFRHAAAMVGNSSSGIIEAGSFGLPVVNIGNRQSGRVRGANVIDVDGKRAAILAAIQRAVSPEFREKLRDAKNPYRIAGTNAADLILNRLKTVSVDDRLLCKRFHDLHDQ